MPAHFAYQPACHGSYYFAPYNYTTALKQQAYTRCQNQDPRFPYSVPVFEHAYNEIIGDREINAAGEDIVQPTKRLPNLADLLNSGR